MFHHRLSLSVLLAAVLAGCSASGTPGTSPVPLAPSARALQATSIPPSFVCDPKIAKTNARAPHIAYASACTVAATAEHDSLQKLAIAMMSESEGNYTSYCTGTPIAYDPTTRIGFIVTAAHCVVGGRKAAGATIKVANITTFAPDDDMAEIYQKTPALHIPKADLTAEIMAVYVPSQYCKVPAIAAADGTCKDLAKQNGDIAVLKVRTTGNAVLGVLASLRLAPENATIARQTPILALGYGTNTSPAPGNRVLHYINYEYFADNSYESVDSQASIMNGYARNSRYYSIICQGDSGGGDFYWDGSHFNLIGAHSWGPNPCGVTGFYDEAFDVSADIRPFTEWIDRIVREDTSATGCGSFGARYVCASRPT
jgi:hypothetical protein